MKHKKLRALCEGAIMVALATALSYLKLLRAAAGRKRLHRHAAESSSTVRAGASARRSSRQFAYGLLQLLLDGAYAWGPTSMLLDYLLAFGVLGVAGLLPQEEGRHFHRHGRRLCLPLHRPLYQRHHDLQDLRADRAVQLHVHQSVSLFRSLQRQLRVHRHGALPRDHGADLQAAEKVHQRHRSCQVKKTAPACAVLQAGAFFYFRVR